MNIEQVREAKQTLDEFRELCQEINNDSGTKTPSANGGFEPGTPVLVCTEHRGVFYGVLESYDPDDRYLIAENVRNCIYWSKSMGGFGGLSTVGPDEDCNIGRLVERARIEDVTWISRVTEEAREAWLNAETHA